MLRQLIRVGSGAFHDLLGGPPGVGKTTLARIIANKTQAHFIDFSAVTSGIKEIKDVMQRAEKSRLFGESTILFSGRDSPFQQGTAGRFSAVCGARQHHLDRRHDGKPLV